LKSSATRPVILVSACLVGCRARYDGTIIATPDERLERWMAAGLVLPFCPETAGGLPVPRPPAEIAGGVGQGVLAGSARIRTCEGSDVTAAFVDGARLALEACRRFELRLAVLKEGSPSCGTTRIYDGHFRHRRVAGQGVTTALLAAHGIGVYNEDSLAALKVPV